MSHPCGHRPTRRRPRIGPTRLVSWRWAKPLLRSKVPQVGQGGQGTGRWARSASTYSTMCRARKRANGHGQDQLRERLGLFDRVEQLLHGGIIMTYAVAEA
jgi:hypothetical protein